MPEPRNPKDALPAPVVTPDARERVVAVLTHLFADDRLTEAELEARLERVYHATSGRDLEAILADVSAAGAEATAVVAADAAAPRVDALLSAVERQWTGVVPRRLEVRGRLGYVELDLTDATFEPGVTVIDVRAFMGYVQLRLPAGVRVESHGRAFAGFFALKGAGAAGGNAPVVRITGKASFGFAECIVAGESATRLPPGAGPRGRLPGPSSPD
jgi:hypothetical protein